MYPPSGVRFIVIQPAALKPAGKRWRVRICDTFLIPQLLLKGEGEVFGRVRY